MNKLEQLRKITVIVADTGDLNEIAKVTPQDATTNPSLLLKVAQNAESESMLVKAIALCDGSVEDAADQFSVIVGGEILKLVPGRISTEIDARLSFDTEAMIAKARKIIALYESQGIEKERVLIKIAATWEGIQAAKLLEEEGIRCNLTLLFSFVQAAACALANVFLISPFVGRIFDWHAARGHSFNLPGDDPGVMSVAEIYAYYKTHGYKTIVMGASFRNAGQIEALSGCDYLTISPSLIDELSKDRRPLRHSLKSNLKSLHPKITGLKEKEFRWRLNDDAMATDKLAEGIRAFAADQSRLEEIIASKI